MLRASALYLVIILSFIIAVILSTLIATGYFYRMEYQKLLRYERLSENLESAVNLVLSADYRTGTGEHTFDLFDKNSDSVLIRKEYWGIYGLADVRAFSLQDTLKKVFMLGPATVQDKLAMYVADEDRPISVSGDTRITGDAALPKAGIKQAYVEGRPYSGKEEVQGRITESSRVLPPLRAQVLEGIESLFDYRDTESRRLPDSLGNSFFNPGLFVFQGNTSPLISNKILQGRIILISDSLLTIENTVQLKDVIIVAPAIRIAEGFRGSGQFFARDSIVTGKNCVFAYPSCLGILKKEGSEGQAKIILAEGSQLTGILFASEKKQSDLPTMISLGKNSVLKGEVYSPGFVKMDKPVRIEGKVSCRRFVIQTSQTLYENYLLDITINRPARNKYYLGSELFDTKGRNEVLKWLH